MTEKEQLHRLIDALPDEDAIEELQYQLYVIQKVRKGLSSIDAGMAIEHEEVIRRLSHFLV